MQNFVRNRKWTWLFLVLCFRGNVLWSQARHTRLGAGNAVAARQAASRNGELEIGALANQVDSNRLKRRVEELAILRDAGTEQGKAGLKQIKQTISESLKADGFEMEKQPFHFGDFSGENLIAKKRGIRYPDSIVILCAAFDGVKGSPGANNNASGLAAVLEIAHILSPLSFSKTIVVLSTDYTGEEFIGSNTYVFKGGIKPGEKVAGMLDLDRIGTYSERPNTHPVRASMSTLFPDNYKSILEDSSRADFLRVVSNTASRPLADLFRHYSAVYEPGFKLYVEEFPGYGEFTRGDVDYLQFSDHVSFWYRKYKAIWLTDAREGSRRDGTADDIPAHLNYTFLSRVVRVALTTLVDMAGPDGLVSYKSGRDILLKSYAVCSY